LIGFTQWIEENPFYVNNTWDYAKGKWSGPGRLVLAPHQKRILGHCLTPDAEGRLPYDTVIYSAPKKSGKTCIAAAVAAWYLDQAVDGTEGYICANDKDHAAGLILPDIKYHCKQLNNLAPVDEEPIKMTQYRVTWQNDTFIEALSSAYRTASGSRHSLVVAEEIWGITSEEAQRMWDEMTIIPTVSNPLKFVATYAGFINESKLLWELYINGVGTDEHDSGKGQRIEELGDLPCWKNGRQFTYWDHLPRLMWQTDDYYESQSVSLRPAAYLRLHENQWVSTHETFIPIEWWDRAATHYPSNGDLWLEHPYRGYPVFIGVDAATKKDCTAAVGVTLDTSNGKMILMFHKIWTPHEGDPLDLESTLEAYLMEQAKRYLISEICYDPVQLQQMMARIRAKGIPTFEFSQHPNNMVKASQALFDLLKSENLWAYPSEDMREHLMNAVAKEEGRGFRIVKDMRNKTIFKPQDAVISLAMAVYRAIEKMGMSMPTNIIVESPFSDMARWGKVQDTRLPFELRD
jgi:phage terminase large subunit-like protein